MGHLRDGVWHKGALADHDPRRRVPAQGRASAATGSPPTARPGRTAARRLPGRERALPPLRLLRLPLGAPDADLPRAEGARAGTSRSTSCIRCSATTAGPSTPTSPARPATGSAAGGSCARSTSTHDPGITSRVTVPVLWDKATGTIVSNESAEIIRMLNSAFDRITGNTLDFSPAGAARRDRRGQRPRLRRLQQRRLPRRLRPQPGRLRRARPRRSSRRSTGWRRGWRRGAGWSATGRPRPTGGSATTLFRFDAVYHGHFKCNRRRIVDYPNLWAYARELYQWPGVAGTVRFDHIAFHYYASHRSINPTRHRADRPGDRLDARRTAAPRRRRPDAQPPEARRLALGGGAAAAVVLDQRRHVLEPQRRAQQAAGVRHQLEDRPVREEAARGHRDDRQVGVAVGGEVGDRDRLALRQLHVEHQRLEAAAAERGEGLGRGAGERAGHALAREEPRPDVGEIAIAFDDQNPHVRRLPLPECAIAL